MLFISPPFGNYLSLPKTISITGSFTLQERPGKWKRIFKTLNGFPIGMNDGMPWNELLVKCPVDSIVGFAFNSKSN